ncbi:hypothetical protein ACSTIF_22495 [Vibrio parahaemolyticus]
MITFRQGKLGLGMSIPHIRVQNGSEIYLFKASDYSSMLNSLRLAAPYERKSARFHNPNDFESYYLDLRRSVLEVFKVTDSISRYRP